jgi:crossover junction endodeoxyribonuclease RuvC
MKIIGIDPGTHRLGFGVVEFINGNPTLLEAGLLSVQKSSGTVSLADIKRRLDEVLLRYTPHALAIERLFFAKNQKTALRVAEARGVVLLAADEQGIPIYELTPNEIKLGITGYGASDKKAVLKMVRLILKRPDLTVIDDVSDALAVALVAGQFVKIKNYPQVG